ncbi:MAG TPA: amino acid ABC transporter ATP-binding protein [Clostridiaceae bacterium]|nr:amino acid ABC transporter ATP-binding protein [Clostridiaceae bacterium]
MIHVENIKKSFGELEVLKGISFDVNQGDVYAIIGPSGSGKSTLLRCLNQLERADSGHVTICDKMLLDTDAQGNVTYCDVATAREIQLDVGLVFQNFNLFPHLSILENITEAPIHVLGQSKGEAVRTAEGLLAKLGLPDKRDAYPFQLSGGQQQRVSIARALALNPKILCFDEPTSALDPELTGEVLRVIHDLAEENMTMIIVTHEMRFAEEVADQVIFMDQGVIIEAGTPYEIFNQTDNERTMRFLQKIQNQ